VTSIEPSDRDAWAVPDVAAPAGRPVLATIAATGSDPTVGRRADEPVRSAAPARGLRGSPVWRLAPQTVGQLLDGGFEVLRFRFRTLMVVAAVVMLPLYALPALLVGVGPGAPDNPLEVFGDPETVARMSRSANPFEAMAGGLASWLGLGVGLMVLAVAVSHLVVSWATGSDPGPRAVLVVAVRRLPVAIGAWTLAALAKVVSALPCYLGLIYTLPVLSLLGPVVAAEGIGPIRSLRRAVALGRRRFGSLLGLSVLATVVSSVVSWGLTAMAAGIAFAVLGGDLTSGETPDHLWLVIQSVQVVANILLSVVLVGATALAYVDARVRTEALDLELEVGERFGRVG